MTRRLLHRGEGKATIPFPGLLYFILDPYLIILSVKQGGIKYHFWVFSMTRSGIEHRSPGSLTITQPFMPMNNQHAGYQRSIYRLRHQKLLSESPIDLDLDSSFLMLCIMWLAVIIIYIPVTDVTGHSSKKEQPLTCHKKHTCTFEIFKF